MTRDDTLVNVLVDYGTITEDQAKFHPRKNILVQAVGATEVLKISFYKQSLENGLLLLCSDGLSNSLNNQQMSDILMKELDTEKMGDELMNQALICGGSDNVSFIILNKGVLKDE